MGLNLTKSQIIKLGALAAAVTAIGALFTGVMVGLNMDLPPWAAQARVTKLEQVFADKQQLIDQSLIELRKADLETRRANWEKVKIDAQEELKRHPDSVTAVREIDTAEKEIAKIDRALAGIPQ